MAFLLDEYYFKNEKRLKEYLANSKYKYTSQALSRFYNKLESISRVMINIDLENDNYVIFILMRSYIEHFIVIVYIWLKFIIERNDETAEDYYSLYPITELFKKIGYNDKNEIQHTSKYARAVSKAIESIKLKGYNIKPFYKILNASVEQFDIRIISQFIIKELPDDVSPLFTRERIKDLLEQYNYLCSNIHGGPSADLMCYENYSQEIKESAIEYKEISEKLLSVIRVYQISFIAASHEEIKTEMHKEFDKAIKNDNKYEA
jgi:hypothetical protein